LKLADGGNVGRWRFRPGSSLACRRLPETGKCPTRERRPPDLRLTVVRQMQDKQPAP
jgi:hypothetical protein